MNRTVRRTVVALIAALLGALALAGAPPAAAISTQGFHVLNLSGHTLKLVSLTGQNTNVQLPRIATGGNLYPPGVEPVFEVTHVLADNNEVEARFESIDDRGATVGAVTVVFRVDGFGYPYSRTSLRYNTSVTGDGNNGKYLRIFDARPTTIDASGWSSRDQASLVGRMCRHDTDSDGGPVRCEGVITSPGSGIPAFSEWEVVDGRYGNENCSPSQHTFSVKRTKTLTHAWEIEVSANYGLKDVWQAAIKTKYSGSLVESTLQEHTQVETIVPGTELAMVARVPVLRYTGEYSVRAGNTEWIMKNVPVDIIDTGKSPGYTFKAVPTDPNAKFAQKPSFCP